MPSETKNCNSCKTSFVIEPEDFDFYEKLKVKMVKPTIDIFLIRFDDEILKEKAEFNGNFNRIAIGTLEHLLVEMIKLYRDCN